MGTMSITREDAMGTIATVPRLRAGRSWMWPRRSLGAVLVNLMDRVLDWQERAHERHVLRGLDESGLKDIGVSRCDADAEANKPFWHA